MAKILAPQLKEAEFARRVWCASPERGVGIDDMLQPAYWAHVAKTIRSGDRIEAVANDGAWFAEFYVTGSGANEVRVVPLRVVDLTVKVRIDPEYEIKFRGRAKWSVLRLSDKAVMVDGLDDEQAANDWLAKHQAA